MIEFVTAFALCFALYVAVQKNIQPEVIASILTALYMCYEPIKKLGAVSNTIRKAKRHSIVSNMYYIPKTLSQNQKIRSL